MVSDVSVLHGDLFLLLVRVEPAFFQLANVLTFSVKWQKQTKTSTVGENLLIPVRF